MSNRRRPRRASSPSHDGPTPEVPVTRVKDPGDVVTIVPYLLGFEPAESLVIVALEGPGQRFGPCARLDLVDDPDGPDHAVEYVATLVRHHGFGPSSWWRTHSGRALPTVSCAPC